MAIVIVDDTIFSLEVIKSFFMTAGYLEVITVKSAKELYELVDGYSDRGIVEIDLILMDIIMPDVDGIEACRNVKKREWLADVPVIMVTATTEKENLQLAFSAGAMDFIKKPLDSVTVSLGVVTRFSEQAETPDDLILAADRALYRSKHEGRNRVSVECLM